MQKNSQDFSIQEVMRLAKSPAGQQLLALIRQTDSETLTKALQQAASGDYTQAQETLSPILRSTQAQQLLKHLED